jgi:DNA-binding NarL/FixJ family response regulator
MKRARVLLADDHADVAEQLRSILETEFDVIATVGDGTALLAAAYMLDPDVIVTDIAMPGMDGLEATTEILHRTPNARVVMITSHHEMDVQRRALAAGALGYLTKFSANDELLPAVHAACRGERFVGRRATRET